ncbi:hypothetical protein PITC_071730 [Penicillium italicum]|uniref:Uncharacterized protein n=1 Tax=Penicillium italicum TaxID=40296 RepID=A0A0A2LMZ0_PENIT|nr:hypothetical protein PITC_071730 [Penicillium italicum]
MRVLSFDPIRRSFLSSRARRYCVLHLLKACASVIEPLSDWTLKYISTIWIQPPGFRTLDDH